MKILKAGRGTDRPSGNDCVKISYTGWKRDGALATTSQSQPEGFVQCLPQVAPGLAEALRSMLVGEQRRVWLPGSLAMRGGESGEPNASPDLTFDLEILELTKAPTTPTDLKAPPKTAMKTPSGLSFRVLRKGTGTLHPSEASRVTVHVSGWQADGSLIESTVMANRPTMYGMMEIVPGMREGLERMVVGEKARLWIPAALAYGDKPGRRGVPLGDLVYDIELLGIQ